ncbi:MAG TPA: DNA recombination protein RmuC [Ignavibacteria bacterium]|nr:DNA recombination protein RmuC [Ignavibacteria bacterium]
MEIIYLVIGLIIGAVAAYIIAKYKYSSGVAITPVELDDLKSQKTRAEEKVNLFQSEVDELKTSLEAQRSKYLELNSDYHKITTQNINLEEKLENQKKEIERMQEKFSTEFKNIANEILEDKSRRFTEQNQQNLKNILDPLRENISEFRKRVDEIHASDTKSYTELTTHLKNLQELNLRMSDEAENLTKALKGDTKVMGSWGEYVLESILEKSGLVKDDHYSIQESFTDKNGKRLRPDIVIKLPDQKSIIIDSKVSLVAYEKYSSAEDEITKERAVKEHIISLRNHIKGLSAKEYQNIAGLNPPDFVLMFVPIEPAFSLAVQKDPTIFNDAFENNIVIVSPSTLLATLRTIENIWRRESQNKNALEIARRSGALYDKFVGFIEDLDKVGERISQADSAYRDAKNKLSDGRGNILRSIQSIKELGAKASKSLDNNLLESADE